MVAKIKDLTKRSAEKDLEDSVQIYLDFFIFGLETTKSEKAILRGFPVNSVDSVSLFLLRLKLYLKYEGKVLLMPILHFKILLVLLHNVIQRYSTLDVVGPDKIHIFAFIISVASKIFIKDESKVNSVVPVVFSFENIETSLLFGLRDLTLFSSPIFWQSYFEHKYKKSYPNSNSPKMKVLRIAEIMMFYHYYFSCDFEVSMRFVESCLASYNTNLKLLKKPTKFKIGEVLHGVVDRYNERHKRATVRAVLSHREKVTTVLGLVVKLRFIDPREIGRKVHIDRYISVSMLRMLVKSRLFSQRLTAKNRRMLWLKHIKLMDIYEPKPTLPPHQTLAQESLEQIQMDVSRTRQWRGKPYTETLQSLILCFFFSQTAKFEYFQGFNFIVSFLHELFPDQTEFSIVLNYFAKNLINVSLQGLFYRQTLLQTHGTLLHRQRTFGFLLP